MKLHLAVTLQIFSNVIGNNKENFIFKMDSLGNVFGLFLEVIIRWSVVMIEH